MSDVRNHTTGRIPPGLAAAAALAVVAGIALWAVGLPESPSVFGTPMADLTVPAALLVALGGIVLASATMNRAPWRVVELVIAAVLGVAGGLVFAVWNVGWTAATWLAPPASALGVGVWLFPAVLGALVIRKPGAAVYTELIAAVVSGLIGNQWGFSVVYYGLIEGLGAEIVFALLLYRSFGPVTALLAGAGAGAAVGLLDIAVYYADLSPGVQLGYLACAVVSGVVIAGAGSWLLTRALARTGVLAGLASGREAELV